MLNGGYGQIIYINFLSIFNLFCFSCFPHIVNLACKAVLTAITNLKYVDDTVENYEDYEPSIFNPDCIATIRSLVNTVSILLKFIILVIDEISRFGTVTSKSNGSQNMLRHSLISTINCFAM